MTDIICGYGFLGKHLKTLLEKKGRTVVIMPTNILTDTKKMYTFLKRHEPYNFYYLAAYGNLHGQNDVHEIYNACVIKLLNLLDATKETDCRAFITAGTTSEYGDKTQQMKEDMMLQPVTFYGAAKAAATHLAQAWVKQNETPVIIFRPASMTGVGEQSIHLIPTLIRSCLKGEKMPFIGGYYHDYISVKDVAKALLIIAKHAKKHKGEIFNVGTGKQTSNGKLRQMIEKLTGKKINVDTSVKLNPQNVSQVWKTNSNKMRKLGWKPKITLLENLKEMI